MRIIDAQVHLWQSGTPSGHHRQVPAYGADDLLSEMDTAGVAGTRAAMTRRSPPRRSIGGGSGFWDRSR